MEIEAINATELNRLIERWGMYRHDHPGHVYNLGRGNFLTWTDIGCDIRHIYEKYGEWMLSLELQKTYKDFDDFIWTDTEKHMIPVKDIILSEIECEPEIYNKDGFANVLSSKVIKSVAYGATGVQMRTFIRKEIDRATAGRDRRESRRFDGAY